MEDRTKYIGGSDVGAILGVNPWRTPLDVFYEKTGLKEIENVENEYMYWGKKLEPLIIDRFIDLYNEMFPEKINSQIEKCPSIKFHSKYNFLAAHIDAIIYEKDLQTTRNIFRANTILECKTSGNFVKNQWGEEFSDEIPIYYKMQVAHYLNIYDIPLAYIAVLFGGNELKIYEYHRNIEFEKEIEKKLVDFWENNVLKLEPPMPVFVDEAKKLYKSANKDSVIVADNEILDTYYHILDIGKKVSELEQEKDSEKLKLMKFMKSAETLIDNSGDKLVTWKNKKSNRFQTTEFKTSYPDVYSEFLKESTTRTFSIKGVKDNE